MGRNKLQAFNPLINTRDIFVRPDQRMPLIDGVRALSILYVLFFHSLIVWVVVLALDDHATQFRGFLQDTPWYFQWVLMGDRGVDAFFVISGFLIGQILFREYEKNGSINLKRFFVRRWLRLSPVYLLAIAAFALFAGPAIIHNMVQEGMSHKEALWVFWGSIAAYATYLNNFLPYEQGYYIPYAWSLAVEEQFYILFSLFMAFAFKYIKNRLYFLLGLFIASFMIRGLLLYGNPQLLVTGDVLLSGAGGMGGVAEAYWELIYGNLYTRFGAIVPGIILAYVYVYRWQELQQWITARRSNLLVLLALAIIIGTTVSPVFSGYEPPLWMVLLYQTAHRNLFALAVAILILVALFPLGMGAALGRFFSSRLLYPVSQLSYSMYLVHVPVLLACATLLHAGGLVQGLGYGQVFVLLAVAFVPIMLTSGLMYIVVEKPFMKLRRP